ncbi:MAG TPA: hypothetical protein VFA65_14735, partial [Bryobacteraceae bacterium]|nr:hypothetical protein [Bryobacteraceae bacterium]
MTINVLLQVTAIEAIASIVLLCFRRIPPAGKYVFCAVALLIGILTPFLPQVPLPYTPKLLYSVGGIPNTLTVSHQDAFHW